MVIDRYKDNKGIDCFHPSDLQVQVTYFSGAGNVLIGCQSHCLKTRRTPGGWENSWETGNLRLLHPILENKVVAIRSSASGSPRMKPPRLTSFSSRKKLLDW